MSSQSTCPYCGEPVVCRDSSLIYKKSYGYVWICSAWPKCDAYVGCQPGTKRPLGRLANPELRYWKKKAHESFDKLWKSGKLSRSSAYVWLSRKLSIPQAQCHIGMFDIDQCKAVCAAVKNYEPEPEY